MLTVYQMKNYKIIYQRKNSKISLSFRLMGRIRPVSDEHKH